ncbi:L-rhamnose-binding lectin CSL2-like [Hypomesus transpacificus]|uniref:L-rhamnose-binding lectin CSL2-like n=1 Tax=Hypomesus transpacificus TaxID=137520 RepID=UPI001F074E66|nr:L-rhamnose-binding lectin CSL2-like [Hypomesus transpacificus]
MRIISRNAMSLCLTLGALILLACCMSTGAVTTDICEGQQTTLNCGSSVINVVSANYGRTDSVTCISGRPANQISKTDCINPKTFLLVASICNGKKSCYLVASNSVFSDPCYGTYKYLDVTYTCIPPTTGDSGNEETEKEMEAAVTVVTGSSAEIVTGKTVICEGQMTTLNCGSSLIHVVSANYGRTDSVTCISGRPANQIRKTDCINTAISLSLVVSICNGKKSCSLVASNYVFSDPCYGTYKYLDVTYTCIPPRKTVICEGQRTTLNCGSSLIHVVSANYGRTDSVTCISGRPANQIRKTDCINPKTFPLVASICDRKKSCSLVASNSVFSDPCYGTYKYLDVTYTCIPQ